MEQINSVNPKKRGKNAEIFIIIVAVLSLIIGYFLNKNNSNYFEYLYVSVPISCLLIVLTKLIKQISLLFEEFNHLDTRYDNNWFLLIKNTFPLSFRITLIGSLTIPIIINQNPGSVCKTLESFGIFSNFCAILSMMLLSEVIPIDLKIFGPVYLAKMMEDLGGLDSSIFMAYSYYHGFLQIVLPNNGTELKGIVEMMGDFESRENIKFSYNKLIVLVPMSLFCPANLRDHSRITSLAQSLGEIELSRGGVHKRIYKNTVYKLEKDGKRYYVCAEYATPLKTLRDIININNAHANLYKAFQREFTIKFYLTLKDILENSEGTRGLCDLVLFNDFTRNKEIVDVGEIILDHIKKNT